MYNAIYWKYHPLILIRVWKNFEQIISFSFFSVTELNYSIFISVPLMGSISFNIYLKFKFEFILLYAGVFAFRGFLNTSKPEILKSENLANESLNE